MRITCRGEHQILILIRKEERRMISRSRPAITDCRCLLSKSGQHPLRFDRTPPRLGPRINHLIYTYTNTKSYQVKSPFWPPHSSSSLASCEKPYASSPSLHLTHLLHSSQLAISSTWKANRSYTSVRSDYPLKQNSSTGSVDLATRISNKSVILPSS